MVVVNTGTNASNDREHSLDGEKLSLLAVFAHPEEGTFGPAGTLAKYAGEGIRVSLITAGRENEEAHLVLDTRLDQNIPSRPREKLCACQTSGTQRLCLMDHPAGRTSSTEEARIEERLARLMRELGPQVVVTYGPDGLGDPEHALISRLTTRAFQAAGDPLRYPQHIRQGLTVYQPKKLYYNVLPKRMVERWGITGIRGVEDDEVTTVVDVSSYPEAKLGTLYCLKNRMVDYSRWLAQDHKLEWDEEYFTLAASHLACKTRNEKDLFNGLR